MEPDVSAPGGRTRCPSCGAAVRDDAPWCTLCYARLRAAEPAGPDPLSAPLAEVLSPASPAGPASPADLAVPAHQATPADGAPAQVWPCSRCGALNPIDSDLCHSCGAGFLAELRAVERRGPRLPGLGDVTQVDRGRRLLLAGAFVLAVALLTLLLTLL